MKLDINWPRLGKAFAITAGIAGVFTLIAVLAKYAPGVLLALIGAGVVAAFYFFLAMIED